MENRMSYLTREAAHLDDELGAEFEHAPVPPDKRRSTLSVALIWAGFPMGLSTFVSGSLLAQLIGVVPALEATLLGNLALLLYVGLIGGLASRSGESFALQARHVFGSQGYRIASAFLSTIVIGWFAVNAGIGAELLKSNYGLSYGWLAVILSAAYAFIAFLGVRALHWISLFSVSLFLVVAGITLIDISTHGSLGAALNYPGAHPLHHMAFGTAVALVIAKFLDSGTQTADFNRWAPNTRGSWLATAAAFPLGLGLPMALGILVMGALEGGGAFAHGNVVGFLLANHQVMISVLVFAFIVVNSGSVSSHCVYNAATGWSGATGLPMRLMAIVIGAAALIITLSGFWHLYIPWLIFLGILVPPLGTVILAEALITRQQGEDELLPAWRWSAFAAWAIGALAGYANYHLMPAFPTPIAAFLATLLGYFVLRSALFAPQRLARGIEPD
jgi:cytosine permease